MEKTDLSEVLDVVLNHPEDVLSELGTRRTVDLLRVLSAEPEVAEKIRNSEIVKMIEDGRKFVIGKIVREEC